MTTDELQKQLDFANDIIALMARKIVRLENERDE